MKTEKIDKLYWNIQRIAGERKTETMYIAKKLIYDEKFVKKSHGRNV